MLAIADASSGVRPIGFSTYTDRPAANAAPASAAC